MTLAAQRLRLDASLLVTASAAALAAAAASPNGPARDPMVTNRAHIGGTLQRIYAHSLVQPVPTEMEGLLRSLYCRLLSDPVPEDMMELVGKLA